MHGSRTGRRAGFIFCTSFIFYFFVLRTLCENIPSLVVLSRAQGCIARVFCEVCCVGNEKIVKLNAAGLRFLVCRVRLKEFQLYVYA